MSATVTAVVQLQTTDDVEPPRRGWPASPRAIETQSWVAAPAQFGRHDPDGARESYGHSLIVDPWGVVVAEHAEGEGFALAEVDRQRVLEVRRRMPVVAHRRL